MTGVAGYETKPVLKATGTGSYRFYVMALNDFTTSDHSSFYWYANLHGSADSSKTSYAFGSGGENIATMISEWNTNTTSQNELDVWGVIQDKANAGWFVPSNAEWGHLDMLSA